MTENVHRLICLCNYLMGNSNSPKVHMLADGTVGVFSRNSEDMSKKYPDLVEQLPNVRTTIHKLRLG
jgi:hypothetical protein